MNWADVHPKLREQVLDLMHEQRSTIAKAVWYVEDEAFLVAFEAAISLLERSQPDVPRP